MSNDPSRCDHQSHVFPSNSPLTRPPIHTAPSGTSSSTCPSRSPWTSSAHPPPRRHPHQPSSRRSRRHLPPSPPRPPWPASPSPATWCGPTVGPRVPARPPCPRRSRGRCGSLGRERRRRRRPPPRGCGSPPSNAGNPDTSTHSRMDSRTRGVTSPPPRGSSDMGGGNYFNKYDPH